MYWRPRMTRAGDRHLAGALQGPHQQRVRLRTGSRRHVVGGLEEDRIDLLNGDELLQIDRLRRQRHERGQLIRIDNHVPPLRYLDTLNNAVRRHLLTAVLGNLQVADAAHVPIVELVKRDRLRPTAVNSFTGMAIIPKLIVPLQIARAMAVTVSVWPRVEPITRHGPMAEEPIFRLTPRAVGGDQRLPHGRPPTSRR